MTLDPSQSSPFGCAIALALVVFFGFFGLMTVRVGPSEVMPPETIGVPAQAVPEAEKPEVPDISKGPLPEGASLLGVDSAVLDVRDSGQVVVEVNGTWPDGCDLPVEVNTTVTPELISVVVYRAVPPGVFCTMVLQPYSDVIDISPAFSSAEGAIDPARVPVTVNGVTANPLTK